MKNKDLSRLEMVLFIIFCLGNLIPLLFIRWFPSMDGPAHIYSANIVKEILKGNMDIREFFSLSLLVPNLTGSLLLSLLHFVFPAWLAEKLLIATIVVLLPVSFRYFVYSFRKKPTLLTLTIFPFTWHFLFMIGFYNYSLGLSIVLFTLGYYIRTRGKGAIKDSVLLGCLTLLLAFTHIFAFVVFGIIWLVLLLGDLAGFLRKDRREGLLSELMRRYGRYLIVVLPGVLFVISYLIGMKEGQVGAGTNRYLSVGEHFRWLWITRPLIIYYLEKESVYGMIIAAILAIWIVASFFYRSKKDREKKNKTILRYFLLGGTLLILFFYFVLPDFKAGAGGHLSLRLLIPFYLFLLAWLSTRKLQVWLQASGLTGFLFSTVMLWNVHMPELRKMSLEAESLVEAGKKIPAGMVVLPVNAGNNWLQEHFLNYTGAENPLIILDNTVASGGGIIRWANPLANLPGRFGGKLMFEDTALFSDPFVNRQVDAVIVWKADQRDHNWPSFARQMLGEYFAYDTICGGYGWLYVNKKYKPNDSVLLKWKTPVPPRSSALFILDQPRTGNDEFFELAKKPLLPGYKKELVWYRFEVSIRSDSLTPADSVYLACMIENKGKVIDYDALAFQTDTIARTYRIEYHPPFKTSKDDILK
ncbi:MAG: hypothetical protein ACPLXM_04190, partial [Bacteroidales bacterium]